MVGRSGLRGEVPESVQVHGIGLDPEDVSPRTAAQVGAADIGQHGPQPGQIAVQRLQTPLRRVLAPDPVGQLVHRHRLVRVDEQGGEYAPLPGRTQLDEPAADASLDVTEHSEPHGHRDPPSPLTTLVLPAVTSRIKVRARFVHDLSPTVEGGRCIGAAQRAGTGTGGSASRGVEL